MSIQNQSFLLETSRLRLRRLSLDDLDFVAEMLAHPEVMRFYPQRYSREEARAWIERQLDRYARHGHALWLVVDKQTLAPIGQVGVMIQSVDGVDEPEVGYLIHYPFWRRGYASEAAIACRDYAFEVLGKPYVISLIRPVNLPSQGVAAKMGMERWKTTQFHNLEHIVFRVHNPKFTEVG